MKAIYSTLILFLVIITGFTTVKKQTVFKKKPTSIVPFAINTAAPPVEGWFFRAVSGWPAAIKFELVALFKNGEYYEVGEEPLEILNIDKSKTKNPAWWGTWKKEGEVYYLTNSKNESNDYKLGSGNWFPAYSYSGSPKLKTAYKRTSGGDYGNGTNALAITKINFVDATHFNEATDAGVSTPNAGAWKKSSSEGSYKIDGNMIVLTYSDGKVIKKSFALGASGSPAMPTVNMIFIGGDAYTDSD